MKSTITAVLLLLLAIAPLTSFGKKSSRVHVLSRQLDCFYFKIDRATIGAVVEVFDGNGKKVAEKTLNTRRNLLDFYYEQPGHFTIKIKKGTEIIETFDYQKNNPYAQPRVKPVSVLVVSQQ